MPSQANRQRAASLRELRAHHRLGAAAAPGTVTAFRTLEDDVINARLQSRRAFRYTAQDIQLDIHAGRIPVVEVSTASDGQVARDLAISLHPAPILLTIGHEEERRDKGHTPQEFRARYDAIFPVLREASNALIGATYMNFSARGQNTYVGSRDAFQSWLPTKGQIDFLGFDLYVHQPGKPTAQPAHQLHDPILLAGERNVPLVYAEFAVEGTQAARAAYTSRYLAYVDELRTNGCQCAPVITCWFHSDVGAATPTVYDGTRSWYINKASDQEDTLTPAVFRDYLQRPPATPARRPTKRRLKAK